MKPLCILLIFTSTFVVAEEDCVFDKNAYINFIKSYKDTHKNSKIESDGKTLIVKNGAEKVTVEGGGCNHLGASIKLKSSTKYDENTFFQEVLNLSKEYAAWLIDIETLKSSIENMNWKKIDSSYYFHLDDITVFEATYDNEGNVIINFYIS